MRNRRHTLAASIVFRVVGLATCVFLTSCASLTGGSQRLAAPSIGQCAGVSMEPAIHRGTCFFVRPIDIEDVKRGDIVTVYWPGLNMNVVHRVVALRYGANGRVIALETKGDANIERDRFIATAAELVGKVEL